MTLIQTLCCAALLAAVQAHAADLTIHIGDVKEAGGTIQVSLYNSAGTFMKTAVATAAIAAINAANTVVLKDLPAGEYAFAVFHDANANAKLDKNMFGIPTEGYGFSNNAMGAMGPPSFGQASFTLPGAGAALRVSLR
ncbi:DUF2141 domain-containing protein [Massilia psychrophila]|jgi:uncharacterized protein (DUF2141 family)|uniref:DUF2141 domain-containing protein n=1 Tax=Massilia psychrophila TaxID=1603353 RepID=A0A2G8T0T4_9BURK|nr:DUF2141 domain-containing protein [Massilia psychrophila]PIL39592.1 hypothetical protein CR103_11795 [Massilia psychrophila]GGE74113.1 hypothetical protein GCM10008020_18480 [Massilia psychrophila]